MASRKYEDPDDDPEVIQARAESRAKILEARSKLHPVSQFVYTLIDSLGDFLGNIGCLVIFAIVVIAIFAPQLFDLFLKR